MLLKNKFSEFGIKILSHTPEREKYHRGLEILEWLRKAEEEICSFVILDDDLEVCPLQEYLVRTFMDRGLQDEHVRQAIQILNGEQ